MHGRFSRLSLPCEAFIIRLQVTCGLHPIHRVAGGVTSATYTNDQLTLRAPIPAYTLTSSGFMLSAYWTCWLHSDKSAPKVEPLRC